MQHGCLVCGVLPRCQINVCSMCASCVVWFRSVKINVCRHCTQQDPGKAGVGHAQAESADSGHAGLRARPHGRTTHPQAAPAGRQVWGGSHGCTGDLHCGCVHLGPMLILFSPLNKVCRLATAQNYKSNATYTSQVSHILRNPYASADTMSCNLLSTISRVVYVRGFSDICARTRGRILLMSRQNF